VRALRKLDEKLALSDNRIGREVSHGTAAGLSDAAKDEIVRHASGAKLREFRVCSGSLRPTEGGMGQSGDAGS